MDSLADDPYRQFAVTGILFGETTDARKQTMHIEPGVVSGAKLVLSNVTATGAIGYGPKLARDTIRQEGISAFAIRSGLTDEAGGFRIHPETSVTFAQMNEPGRRP